MSRRDKTQNKTQQVLFNKVWLQHWPAWSAKPAKLKNDPADVTLDSLNHCIGPLLASVSHNNKWHRSTSVFPPNLLKITPSQNLNSIVFYQPIFKWRWRHITIISSFDLSKTRGRLIKCSTELVLITCRCSCSRFMLPALSSAEAAWFGMLLQVSADCSDSF